MVALITLLLATLGFLSPAARGALLTTAIVLFVLMAFVAGGGAVALWGVMERSYEGWVGVALQVSLWLPGIIMLIFTLLNIALKHTGSLGAVPAGIYFSIVGVWFLVSVPLTFVGGYMATRIPIIDYPVKTNQIPRQVPPAPLVAHPVLLFFSAGVSGLGRVVGCGQACCKCWGACCCSRHAATAGLVALLMRTCHAPALPPCARLRTHAHAHAHPQASCRLARCSSSCTLQ
jgi:hypothetical protein